MRITGLAKSIIRYIVYGKQIGITSKTGNAVYKRGNILTGLDKDENIIRIVTKFKTGKYETKTVSKTPIPFSDPQKYVVVKHRVYQDINGTAFSGHKYIDDGYRQHRNVYGTPWNIYWHKNRKTGKITGYMNQVSAGAPSLNKRTEFHN